MEELGVGLISSLGFPIFVCLWFMLRTEKIIKSNTDALNSLKTIILNKPRL